jgi:hypothetical protein
MGFSEFACTGTGVNDMRTFRNHTMEFAALVGSSIRVVGRMALRLLPVDTVRLLGVIRQQGQGMRPRQYAVVCACQRANPRWEKSDRAFQTERGRPAATGSTQSSAWSRPAGLRTAR